MLRKLLKVVSVILVVCLCVNCVVFANNDEQQTIIHSDAQILTKPGEIFEFPVYIKNNPGIFGVTLAFIYDENLIEPIHDSEVGVLVSNVVANPRYMNKPQARVSTMNYDNFTDDGVLFTYKFKVNAISKVTTNIGIQVIGGGAKRLNDDAIIDTVECATSGSVVEIIVDEDVVPMPEPTPEGSDDSGLISPIEPTPTPTQAPVSTPDVKPTTNPTATPASASFKTEAKNIRYIAPVKEGVFEPDREATRYEVVEALYNLLDFKNIKSEGVSFSDVGEEWNGMISAFAQTPIISGYPDATFRGEANITRAEFVKVVAVAAELDVNGSFETELTDIKGHWAEGYIGAFVKSGYIYGYPDKTFLPDANITRAEVVAIINRVIEKADDDSAKINMSDTDDSHWAYGAICAAVITK